MNWFERHLNWTSALGYLLSFTLINVLAWGGYITIGQLLIGGIVMLSISGWVIIGKGQTLWWLLLAPIFSPLWLRNKSSTNFNSK